jgi:hypothetical protein
MKGSVCSVVIASLLFLIILTAQVSATTITVSPDVIQKGGQITVSINDLKDGQSFSLSIDGTFAVVPGSYPTDQTTVIFSTNFFNMPFSLNDGTVSATTQGTTYTEFSVKPKGDKAYSVGDNADANGFFTISEQRSVASGVYDFLRLSGVIRPGTTLLTTQMNLLGTKQGSASSPITFNVGGLDNGEVILTAMVEGKQVLAPKTVVIGSGIPTPVPTTAVPTTTATTVAATTTTATPRPTGSVTKTTPTGTIPAATETTRVLGTNPTPTVSAPAIPEKMFYSADRKVSLRTQGVEYAALLMVSESKVPDSWLMVSKAYTIAPDSLMFSPHATISFTTPSSANDYAYFIGRRLTSDWSAVPSTAGSGTIDAEVDLAGTYALMAFRPESTIQPTVTGTAPATTPTPLVTVTTKPKIASIAQAAGSSPAAGPTRTPLDIVVVTGALVAGIALFGRARR